ncbi:TonB-dependent receptor [Flavobacterium agricola]|uniref:TonB-dependent receptor n=1 Tax=Flavobacterium agricola TaxID=2870839 RepID=A0ABY6LYY9_9FLAO|nr:TonB-dependent receptor [Flavobacterium agricola]UYW01217.1 TonB-dependent receptor [Flavobacterium agricola]
MRNLFIAIALCMVGIGMAQNQVAGVVRTSNNETLPGAHVHLSQFSQPTNPIGGFEFNHVSDGKHRLVVSFVGYKTKDTILDVTQSVNLELILQEDQQFLNELVVVTNAQKQIENISRVSQKQILENYSGSFALSLAEVPGVNASQIGAGQSKPIIRGLSANRVAVTENGVKQEGQQWGADHGLEIDAFNTEKVSVIKGVGTIAYGSDAMGGVIAIDNTAVPADSLTGVVNLLAKSVNDGYGANVQIKQKKNALYYKLNATFLDYADYKVPTNQIQYLNYLIPIYNQRLKNTAGTERNFTAQVGYVNNKLHSFIQVSNNYVKAGFFPGAHGVPNIGAVQPDGNIRNIEFPYQSVNHFKVLSNSTYITEKGEFSLNLGFQNNHRQEWSKFHTHYSNQLPPENNPDLELDFKLITLDNQFAYKHKWNALQQTKVGLQYQYQQNKSTGYSYLLPNFDRKAFGVFATHEYQLSSRLKADLGVRFDYADLKIQSYYDQTLYDYLVGSGKSDALANYYALRTPKIDRTFNAYNFALGFNYVLTPKWNVNFTAASNFRFPTAIELGSNGIHHGAFRHEQGDANLNPEKGWAFDAVFDYQSDRFALAFSPYLYYFTNYIYLKPSGQFSILPHGGQIYTYTQSEAILGGFEIKATQKITDRITAESVFEYLKNQQITANRNLNYALPFTPANSVFAKVSYAFGDTNVFKNSKVYFSGKYAFEQNNIAQNEEITPHYTTFGAGINSTLVIKNFKVHAQLTATNLFNEKYFNHNSYYRAIQIPELGRNIQLLLSIPF